MIANLEAEGALIGAMLIENEIVDAIADRLTPADFAEPVHGRLFEVIIREASLGRRANFVTLKSYFENDARLNELGGIPYIAGLTADSTGLLAPFELARQIGELASRRRMYAGLSTAADACADLDVSPAEILEHADAALSGSAPDAIHQPTAGQCFDELLDSFNDKAQGVTSYSIPTLDGLLGPMRPKQLVIGAARPGMGKTAMALSYALGAAYNGHGVLFVSLEMSSTELAARMASCASFNGESGVPYSFIRDAELTQSQKRRVAEIGSDMHRVPLQIVDAGSLTTGRLNMLIRRHARRMAAQGHKLELVVVDYLQLLHPDTKGRSVYEAVSEVSRSLKAAAKDHGVAILALAQLSRSVEQRPDKRPQLSDLRDSGQIEQDADAVFFLLREEYYLRQAQPDQSDPKWGLWKGELDRCQGEIEFIVAKRRNGETGKGCAQFHGAYQAVIG